MLDDRTVFTGPDDFRSAVYARGDYRDATRQRFQAHVGEGFIDCGMDEDIRACVFGRHVQIVPGEAHAVGDTEVCGLSCVMPDIALADDRQVVEMRELSQGTDAECEAFALEPRANEKQSDLLTDHFRGPGLEPF